jgi:RES domain.
MIDDSMKDKLLCCQCIDEAYLKNMVSETGSEGTCNFCGVVACSFTLGELSELVEGVFEDHYQMSFPQMPDYAPDGEPAAEAIMNLGGFPENAAVQIREILEDDYYSFDAVAEGEAIPFGDDTYYVESSVDVRDLESQWGEFERTLKTEARFFNAKGFALLESIFTGLEELSTKSAKSALLNAGPGCEIDHLYRARVFQSTTELQKALIDPVRELGPPPANQAVAGRMNAQGIAVFYGSDQPEIAVAEVRPPVGSEVAVAKFEIIKELVLLDLTAFPALSPSGSLFDPVFSEKRRKTQFLKNLSHQMAIPVMPNEQANEYLVTQAIADFLSYKTDVVIDGIIYPSVQTDQTGTNVILFHKSSRVEAISHPENIRISSSVRDLAPEGYEKSYTIYEEKISEDTVNAYRKIDPFNTIYGHGRYTRDNRKPVLRLDTDHISIHDIKGVRYTKDVQPVFKMETDYSSSQDLDW